MVLVAASICISPLSVMNSAHAPPRMEISRRGAGRGLFDV
jgi:hypothetical protein